MPFPFPSAFPCLLALLSGGGGSESKIKSSASALPFALAKLNRHENGIVKITNLSFNLDSSLLPLLVDFGRNGICSGSFKGLMLIRINLNSD